MFMLTRKLGERLIINVISVLAVSNAQIKLGIDAPKSVQLYHEELLQKLLK